MKISVRLISPDAPLRNILIGEEHSVLGVTAEETLKEEHTCSNSTVLTDMSWDKSLDVGYLTIECETLDTQMLKNLDWYCYCLFYEFVDGDNYFSNDSKHKCFDGKWYLTGQVEEKQFGIWASSDMEATQELNKFLSTCYEGKTTVAVIELLVADDIISVENGFTENDYIKIMHRKYHNCL